eukprot:TRINITY_DN2803_c0_g2_i1.p1 TRINITY_DN2803_c0_g2~~TRINITY_DN2803_c0_g2_i1.p1  ORF type:complete len:884 (-),score=204.16 TRINITY_DN2803_c0_g2_i1:1596-4247(-)
MEAQLHTRTALGGKPGEALRGKERYSVVLPSTASRTGTEWKENSMPNAPKDLRALETRRTKIKRTQSSEGTVSNHQIKASNEGMDTRRHSMVAKDAESQGQPESKRLSLLLMNPFRPITNRQESSSKMKKLPKEPSVAALGPANALPAKGRNSKGKRAKSVTTIGESFIEPAQPGAIPAPPPAPPVSLASQKRKSVQHKFTPLATTPSQTEISTEKSTAGGLESVEESSTYSKEELTTNAELLQEILNDEEKKKTFRAFLVRTEGKDALLTAYETFHSFEKQNSKVASILRISIAQALWDTINDGTITFPEEIVHNVQLNLRADKFDPETLFRPSKEFVFDFIAKNVITKYKVDQNYDLGQNKGRVNNEKCKKNRRSVALVSPRTSPDRNPRPDSTSASWIDLERKARERVEGKIKKRKLPKEQQRVSKVFADNSISLAHISWEDAPKKPKSELVAEQLIEALELSEGMLVPDQILSSLPPQTKTVVTGFLEQSHLHSLQPTQPLQSQSQPAPPKSDLISQTPSRNSNPLLGTPSKPSPRSSSIPTPSKNPAVHVQTPGLGVPKSKSNNLLVANTRPNPKKLNRMSASAAQGKVNRNTGQGSLASSGPKPCTGPAQHKPTSLAEPSFKVVLPRSEMEAQGISLRVASLISPRILADPEPELDDHMASEEFEAFLAEIEKEKLEEEESIQQSANQNATEEEKDYLLLKARLEQLQKQAQEMGLEPEHKGSSHSLSQLRSYSEMLIRDSSLSDLADSELSPEVLELLEIIEREKQEKQEKHKQEQEKVQISSAIKSSSSLPSAPSRLNVEESKWIVLRKLGASRGGVKVCLPPTMEELIRVGSELLHIKGAKVRELETEAVILDVSAIESHILYLTTEEEEKNLF